MSQATESPRPYTPVEELPDERFEEIRFPDGREPASLIDLQFLYGKFVVLGQEFAAAHSLTREHRTALTLQEAEVEGKEQGIVYLNVELDTESETLTPVGTSVQTPSQWDIEKSAFSHYDAKRGVDHSLTQRTGQTTPSSKVATSQLEKITRRWATEDSIKPLSESHEQGWIIERLQSLSEHEAMEDITTELEEELTGRKYRLLTIRFYEDEQPAPGDDDAWVYPADLPVLSDAMVAHRKAKWATKNDSEAAGTAAGYVDNDGDEKTVYGMGTDPLSLYTGKKRAWMPRLSRDESPAAHPVTEDVTGAISQATPLLDACSQAAGLSLYHLPYFGGEQTVEKLRWLYQLLWETYLDRQAYEDEYGDDDDAPAWSTLESFYEDCQAREIPEHLAESISVWTIAIDNVQSSRKRALTEIKNGSLPRYIQYAEQASIVAGQMTDSWMFNTHEWEFTSRDTDFLPLITSPRYFINTTVTTTDEDEVDANAPGYRFYRQFFSDGEISVSELLEAYVEAIDERYRSNLEDNVDYPVPSYTIIRQFTQLCVLDRCNTLNIDIPINRTQLSNETPTRERALRVYQPLTDLYHEQQTDQQRGNNMTNNKSDAQKRAEAEEQAYRAMVENQVVLAENPARRAAFTLGSLITTISGYQRGDVEPLSAKLSPTSISRHNFEEYVTEVIELINRYATADNKAWRYTAQTSQLTEDLTACPPEEWELSTGDVQYTIALGMAFGAEQHTSESAENSDGETADTEADAATSSN